MSKGVNVNLNLPEALWEKLVSDGSPGAIIVSALECYYDVASCVALPPADGPGTGEDKSKAPAKAAKSA